VERERRAGETIVDNGNKMLKGGGGGRVGANTERPKEEEKRSGCTTMTPRTSQRYGVEEITCKDIIKSLITSF